MWLFLLPCPEFLNSASSTDAVRAQITGEAPGDVPPTAHLKSLLSSSRGTAGQGRQRCASVLDAEMWQCQGDPVETCFAGSTQLSELGVKNPWFLWFYITFGVVCCLK